MFNFENSNRPREASKQLRDALASISHPASLKDCQDMVARMTGHDGWKGLLASIGQGRSPEDADIPADDLNSRIALQEAVLTAHGLTPSQAGTIRATLSLTGRSANDMPAYVQVGDPNYHPERLINWTDALMPEGSYSLWDVSEHIDVWMDENTPAPLDVLATTDYSFEEIFHLADEARKTGYILDASAVARQLATEPLPEFVLDKNSNRADGTLYVHFGHGIFPSPYPGCDIDGCYVTFENPTPNGDYRGLSLCFTVSEEGFEHVAMDDTIVRDKRLSVLEASRHIQMSAQAPDDDPYGPVSPEFGFYSEGGAPLAEVWKPFLAGPKAAAIHACEHERRATLPVVIGLTDETSVEATRRIAHARDGRKLNAAFKTLREEWSLGVKFLVKANPDVLGPRDEYPRMDLAVPGFPAPFGNPMDWYDYYLDRAETVSSPAGVMRFTGKAMAMAEHLEDRVHRLSVPLSMRSDVLAAEKMFALAASELAKDTSEEDYDEIAFGDTPLRPLRIAALTAAAGDIDGARAALESLHSDDVGSTWTRALLLAFLEGGSPAAQEAISRAVDMEPAVPDAILRLVEIDKGRTWLDRSPFELYGEGQHEVYDIIAALHGDAWRAIGKLEMLEQMSSDAVMTP